MAPGRRAGLRPRSIPATCQDWTHRSVPTIQDCAGLRYPDCPALAARARTERAFRDNPGLGWTDRPSARDAPAMRSLLATGRIVRGGIRYARRRQVTCRVPGRPRSMPPRRLVPSRARGYRCDGAPRRLPRAADRARRRLSQARWSVRVDGSEPALSPSTCPPIRRLAYSTPRLESRLCVWARRSGLGPIASDEAHAEHADVSGRLASVGT
jgi:hypothetical protein